MLKRFLHLLWHGQAQVDFLDANLETRHIFTLMVARQSFYNMELLKTRSKPAKGQNKLLGAQKTDRLWQDLKRFLGLRRCLQEQSERKESLVANIYLCFDVRQECGQHAAWTGQLCTSATKWRDSLSETIQQNHCFARAKQRVPIPKLKTSQRFLHSLAQSVPYFYCIRCSVGTQPTSANTKHHKTIQNACLQVDKSNQTKTIIVQYKNYSVMLCLESSTKALHIHVHNLELPNLLSCNCLGHVWVLGSGQRMQVIKHKYAKNIQERYCGQFIWS